SGNSPALPPAKTASPRCRDPRKLLRAGGHPPRPPACRSVPSAASSPTLRMRRNDRCASPGLSCGAPRSSRRTIRRRPFPRGGRDHGFYTGLFETADLRCSDVRDTAEMIELFQHFSCMSLPPPVIEICARRDWLARRVERGLQLQECLLEPAIIEEIIIGA